MFGGVTTWTVVADDALWFVTLGATVGYIVKCRRDVRVAEEVTERTTRLYESREYGDELAKERAIEEARLENAALENVIVHAHEAFTELLSQAQNDDVVSRETKVMNNDVTEPETGESVRMMRRNRLFEPDQPHGSVHEYSESCDWRPVCEPVE